MVAVVAAALVVVVAVFVAVVVAVVVAVDVALLEIKLVAGNEYGQKGNQETKKTREQPFFKQFWKRHENHDEICVEA